MKYRRFIKFLVIYISFLTNNAKAGQPGSNLKRLLDYNSKTPLIAILIKHSVGNKEPKSDNEVLTPEIKPVEPPHDQELYNFYHVLRTTQENEEVDSGAAMVFEKTENILRQALRARCTRLDWCIRKCPVTVKITCTITCREEYDDYNMCEKPKRPYCKPPKCGKTMPPAWLLRK